MCVIGRRGPTLGRLLVLLLLTTGCKKEGSSSERAGVARQSRSGALGATKLIVVLGSSTSAGIGPSKPENAWVPRYARFLAQRFPAYEVLSLAVGGQTTYHIQPRSFTPPPGRPAPSLDHNIDAALALRPSAIVINLPSNDAAARYSAEEQLANFDRVIALAGESRVPVWVTTTQPRNFGDAAQLTLQVQLKDTILRRFAPRTLDFWAPFATTARRLDARFDAGDGTHLNDSGHALLLDVVIAAGIPEAALPLPLAAPPG